MIEYRILGPLQVRAADRLLEVEGERQQRLLGLLLLNADRVVVFDELIGNLWTDPPKTARRQISNAAVSIRRMIADHGRGELVTTGRGYRLNLGADSLDLLAFDAERGLADAAAGRGDLAEATQHLRSALAQWRGPLLAGLQSETIVLARQNALERRLSAVERLADALVAQEDGGALVTVLANEVAEHPLRETLRVSLMRALDAAGRPAEALAAFEEGRVRLREDLGVDPGPELRAEHARILRGQPEPDSATPDASGPARHHLPIATADFTGRATDVARVLAVIEAAPPAGPVTLSIEGMGGVGKTALAVHVAHRVAADYAGGQYYVDLRGFSEGERPMTVDTALEVLLRQSGVAADRVPVEPRARREAWRSRVAERRILVVLDNAVDAAQVRTLIAGGPGSLVLVTSRHQMLSLDGAVPVDLDLLTADDALAMFRQIAGPARTVDEAEAVGEVLELCGHLPLAIRLAAARFRRRPSWTVAYLAEQLHDERRARILSSDDRSVMGVIRLSYHHLSEPSRQVFRLLGSAPLTDCDRFSVAALAGVPVAEAEDRLEELVECSLLNQTQPDRYGLHDLVRHCARDLDAREPATTDRRVAHERLLDYFVHFADTHGRRITVRPPRFDPVVRFVPAGLAQADTQEDDVRLLTAEYPNLVAATEHAAAHGWPTRAWQLPCALLPYFTRLGRRSGVVELARVALTAARDSGDRRGEAMALVTIAFALREQGKYDEVVDALHRSIALSEELGDHEAVGEGMRDLGAAQFQVGLMREARATYAKAREFARAAGDRSAEIALTANLAVVDSNLGRHDEALAQLRDVFGHYEATGSVEGQAIIMINVGWVHYLSDHEGEAVAALVEALRLSRSIGFGRGETQALSWLAVTRRVAGDLDGAISCGLDAVEKAREADLRGLECEALTALGEAYLAVDAHADAMTMFRTAEQVARQGSLAMYGGRAWDGIAHVAARQGRTDRARRAWERALALYPEGVISDTGAREHLAAIDRDEAGGVECVRCRRGRPSDKVVFGPWGEAHTG